MRFMHIPYSYMWKCRFVTIYRLVMLGDRQHQVSHGGNYDKFFLLMYILDLTLQEVEVWSLGSDWEVMSKHTY